MGEKQFRVLSALGPDRTGLVSEVTHYLTERGANVEDSRMALLGGEFGLMALVSGSASALSAVESDLRRLEEQTGLSALMRATDGPRAERFAPSVAYSLSASAMDHEGIVRSVSGALSRLGINIVSLNTTAYSAPETGLALFRLDAMLQAPETLSSSEIRNTLDDVAHIENLDFDLRRVD